MRGKCSEFGGSDDLGMSQDSGLALYEPWEANRRGDIFFDEDPQWLKNHPKWAEKWVGQQQPTWSRLRTDFYFIALRYDRVIPRVILQNTPYKVRNPDTSDWCIAFLVDWGPHEDTGRLVDCSPGLFKRLSLRTDQFVEVEQLI